MSRAGTSILVYGCYALVSGFIFAVAPDLILVRVGIPPAAEVGVRIAGMLLFAIGIYFVVAARSEFTEFFIWAVYTRGSVVFILAIFVLLGFEKPALLLLGLIDLLFAIWTGFALRSEKKRQSQSGVAQL